MTWPLYGVMMFFMSIVWMTQIAHFFPKSVLLASIVEDDTEVSSLDSASMMVCACVRLTCVGVFKSQQQLLFSLLSLFAR